MSEREPSSAQARRREAMLRGEQAERWVAAALEAKGVQIVGHRWQARGGEIDLIARHGASLRFIEVKARSGDAEIDPLLSITLAKQRRIAAAAEAWLEHHVVDYDELAFLVAVVDTSVEPWVIRWIDDAFDADLARFS